MAGAGKITTPSHKLKLLGLFFLFFIFYLFLFVYLKNVEVVQHTSFMTFLYLDISQGSWAEMCKSLISEYGYGLYSDNELSCFGLNSQLKLNSISLFHYWGALLTIK